MLAEKDAMATIAVKETWLLTRRYGRARSYHVAKRQFDNRRLRVAICREQQGHVRNLGVGKEMDSIVRILKEAGVLSNIMTRPDLRREGDVHVAGEFKAAWFKDPDGNILHINNQ